MFIRERNDKPGGWFAGPEPAAEVDCMLEGRDGGGGGNGGDGTWKENEPMPMPGGPPRMLPIMFEMKLKRLLACGCGWD